MAAVCPTCDRAYDVPPSADGSWLRCLCGNSFQASPVEITVVSVVGVEQGVLAAMVPGATGAAGAADTWIAPILDTVTGESAFTFPIEETNTPIVDVDESPPVEAPPKKVARESTLSKPARESGGAPWGWILGGIGLVGIVIVVAFIMNNGGDDETEITDTTSGNVSTSETPDLARDNAESDSSAHGGPSEVAIVPTPSPEADTTASGIGEFTGLENTDGVADDEIDVADDPRPQLPIRFMIPPDVPLNNFNEVVLQALDTLELSKEIQLRIAEDPSDKNREDYLDAIATTGGWLESAVELAPEGHESVWELLYLLAYCHSQLNRYYEAGVLGEFVAERAPAGSTVAGESVMIAFAAYLKAFQSSPNDAREVEAAAVVRTGLWLDTHTPESPRIAQVRYTVAQVLQSIGQIVQARDWYLKLAAGTPEYGKAIAVVGQLEWNLAKQITNAESSTDSAVDPPALPSGIVDHASLVQAAEGHLREGITLLSVEMSPSDSLVISKAYLAELLVLAGNGPEALQWLSAEPRPVLAEVDPPEGQSRPARDRFAGVRGRGGTDAAPGILTRRRPDERSNSSRAAETVGGSGTVSRARHESQPSTRRSVGIAAARRTRDRAAADIGPCAVGVAGSRCRTIVATMGRRDEWRDRRAGSVRRDAVAGVSTLRGGSIALAGRELPCAGQRRRSAEHAGRACENARPHRRV